MSRILIVEDEEAIADLEKDYLELSDFEVKIENTGDAGLETALAEEFDLVILDLMLPGMDLKYVNTYEKKRMFRFLWYQQKKMISIR
ncbi:Response regulator receiver domain-containing protein [Butyrivibrio sp. YAB3001]|nr:Response regulator receiver domain-containing protein [Butyrivibrio sp. YAB3001]